MAMDFISGPTTTTNAAAAATIPRSPDSDTDTPPHPPPSKRAHQHHQVISSDNNSSVHVSYKECLKNHAASIGAHALDGCCEFMPGLTMNPMDPTSLTCAACGCHRNFHRRDPDDPTPLHHLIPPSAVARKPHSPPSASHLLLSLSGHTHSPSAPSDHDVIHTPAAVTSANNGTSAPPAAVMGFYNNNNNNNGGSGGGANSGGQNGNFQSRKRFRTKFTQEQKEKMYEFSEKIGWKLKKGEEKLVEDFCKQVGVDRSVFKVWMHNNKHSSSTSATTTTTTTATPLTPISSLNKLHKTTTSSSTTTPTTNFKGNLEEKTNNNSSSNNNNSGSNVGMNCGGMLGVGSAHLDFNFANAGAQEAKAQ